MSKHATLPSSALVKNHLNQMKPGESGYMVPWGMWVDSDMRCWLHPTYTFYPSPGGTVEMRVFRDKNGEYGIDIRGVGFEWSPQEHPSYASPKDTQFIPVAVVKS